MAAFDLGEVSRGQSTHFSGRYLGLSTKFGDVTLHVPSSFRANVHATHLIGDVTVTSIEPGPARVDASTTFGDITIH